MVLPLQAFGIGDVIFTQTLIRRLAGDDKILWPVKPWFVEGLLRAYPDVQFVDDSLIRPDLFELKKETLINGTRIIPIRWAEVIQRLPFVYCMKAKYMLYKQDWQTWKELAMWERDAERENELLKVLGITCEPFNLVNVNFKCDASGKVNINPDNGIPNIEMRIIPGFSLFDWAKVFELATEIHTVSTSVIYMFELLDLYSKIHIYIRRPQESNHNNYSYILQKKNYVLH